MFARIGVVAAIRNFNFPEGKRLIRDSIQPPCFAPSFPSYTMEWDTATCWMLELDLPLEVPTSKAADYIKVVSRLRD
jgi:hypothetical protein